MKDALRSVKGVVRLKVKAQAGARRDEVAGLHAGRLRVRTTAAPEGGRANARIEDILAAALGLPRAAVSLAAGGTSTLKEFALDGLGLEEAGTRLECLVSLGARP